MGNTISRAPAVGAAELTVGIGRPPRVSIAGMLVMGVVVVTVIMGPLAAPYSPTEIVGAPGSTADGSWMGTDAVGRDVLSRVLHGGFSVIGLALAATVLGCGVGLAAGVAASLRGGVIDGAITRMADLLLAFPPIILLLVLVTGLGASATVVVIATALINVPAATRVYRAATAEVAGLPYIEAARLHGESSASILGREIVPNISRVLLADFGVRLSLSIIIIAGANFLGFGIQPPAADWGLMVAENRGHLATQPWGVLAPAVLIAALSISLNVIIDSLVDRPR